MNTVSPFPGGNMGWLKCSGIRISYLAESEYAQRLQQIEIERRQLEVEKLRREMSSEPEDSEPVPVAININVVDARVRNDDDGDLTDT